MAKVLVVDDLLYNVELLGYHLVHEGFEVITALSGPEAIERAREEPPDVILLDIVMPGMDGIEVCRRIKGIPQLRTIPILVVSAREEEEDIIRGLDAGAQDYIVKPFNMRIVIARVRAAVRAKAEHDKVSRLNLRLSRLSGIDHLTGLAGHGHFQEALAAQHAIAVRQKAPLSLALLNLDDFASFNHDFGHSAGDQVLESVGQLLLRNVRQSDVAGRYSGDGFALLLPGAESTAGQEMAERLRVLIQTFDWTLRGITTSAGVATTWGESPRPSDLEAAAAAALRYAKEHGRNRVVHHDGLSVTKTQNENGATEANSHLET